MLAGVLLGLGDVAATKALLDENAPLLATQERDFLTGLCEGRLGNYARALGLLRPYINADPPRFHGVSDAMARSLLRTTIADALAAANDPAGAADQLELYAQIDGNRDTDRAYAKAHAT